MVISASVYRSSDPAHDTTSYSKFPESRLCRSQNTGRLVEADDDGGDVNEEVAPGVDGLVGRVDV